MRGSGVFGLNEGVFDFSLNFAGGLAKGDGVCLPLEKLYRDQNLIIELGKLAFGC